MGFSVRKLVKKVAAPVTKASKVVKKLEKSANRLGIKDMAVQGGLQALNTVVPGAGTMAGQMHTNFLQAKAMAKQYGASDVLGAVGDILMNPSVAHAPGLPATSANVPSVMAPNHALTVSRAVGSQVDKAGRPLMVSPVFRQVRSVPSGYVVVRHPTMGTVGMIRSTAVAAGLYKPRKKPPITAGDWNKLRVADRVKKKAKSVATTAGWKTTTRTTARRAK